MGSMSRDAVRAELIAATAREWPNMPAAEIEAAADRYIAWRETRRYFDPRHPPRADR